MRLSEKELSSILQALTPWLSGSGAQLYLFGSRTDSKKRGGDIDLLILAPKQMTEKLSKNRQKMSIEIQNLIGEQRIDITCADTNTEKKDPFLASILPHAILLSDFT